METIYDIKFLKTALTDYISEMKENADTTTVGETFVFISDFLDYLEEKAGERVDL